MLQCCCACAAPEIFCGLRNTQLSIGMGSEWLDNVLTFISGWTFPFKRTTAVQIPARVKEQEKQHSCFHLGQLTACYDETPPCPWNPSALNFQEHLKKNKITSTTVVNMSAHTSGACEHQGKSRRCSKSRGRCCGAGELVHRTDVSSSALERP